MAILLGSGAVIAATAFFVVSDAARLHERGAMRYVAGFMFAAGIVGGATLLATAAGII